MGSRASCECACVKDRARSDTSTHAATARGVRAAVGGIQSLRATPASRQSEKSEEIERLRAELAEVTAERDDYAATVDEFIKGHKRWQQQALTPEKRDHILTALGVGKQSAQYKRVKAILDQMMSNP
jgi:hypothetical protein